MKKYFFYSIISSLLTVMLLGAFNFVVDPYRVFPSPEISGFNLHKAQIPKQTRLHKATTLSKNNFDTLILGSSRAFRSANPEHEYFSDKNAYNLGITGANVREQLAYLKYANRNNKVNEVIIFLDFTRSDRSLGLAVDFKPERFSQGIPKLIQSIKDWSNILFTFKGFKESISTIRQQSDNSDHVSHRGLFTLVRHYKERNFRRIELSYYNTMIEFKPSKNAVTNNFAFHLERLLKYCYEHNIKATLILSPLHARFLEAVYRANLWQEFEDWRKVILIKNNNIATLNKSQPFSVWDFTIYNSMNTEIISDAPGKWFFESSHPNVKYGDIIFESALVQKDGIYMGEQISKRLHLSNLDEHLNELRSNRENYIINNTDQIKHFLTP